jgi:hypothetical protein
MASEVNRLTALQCQRGNAAHLIAIRDSAVIASNPTQLWVRCYAQVLCRYEQVMKMNPV